MQIVYSCKQVCKPEWLIHVLLANIIKRSFCTRLPIKERRNHKRKQTSLRVEVVSIFT